MSSRNLRPIREKEYVTVTCIDNDNTVKAEVISVNTDYVIVELPGGLRITLQKQEFKKNLYVGKHSGLEFECILK